jgi:hypothetical protein
MANTVPPINRAAASAIGAIRFIPLSISPSPTSHHREHAGQRLRSVLRRIFQGKDHSDAAKEALVAAHARSMAAARSIMEAVEVTEVAADPREPCINQKTKRPRRRSRPKLVAPSSRWRLLDAGR